MREIAVFYHTRLSGGDPHIDFDHASNIMAEQMQELIATGLAEAASKLLIGVNGGMHDFCAAACMAPPNAEMVAHPNHFRGELPTMFIMQQWCRSNPSAYVMYHHTKGAIHKGEILYDAWRKRMMNCCTSNWRQCIKDLDEGYESIGCHWLTPEQFGPAVKAPFWGGNFWWAKASFLNTLPQLRQTADTREQFYDAESWIGWGPRRPLVKDYYPGWP
jgi:hypothetical protein